jgi:periplasmic protein TonB
MQKKTNETPESAQETTQSALGRCLVDGDAATKSRDRRRRGEALGISFAIEFAVLAVLILVPLMTSVAQPQLSRLVPPLPMVMGNWSTHNTPQRSFPRPAHHELNFPVTDFQPSVPSPVTSSYRDLVVEGDPSSVIPEGYIPGAIKMTDLSAPHSPIEPPAVDTHKTSEKRMVKSGSVQQAQLITRIEPRYPPLARQTGTQGTVLLHAIISVDGRITALEVVSGHPLLVQAAIDAVRQWRYRPTYLSGEPVEVETSITVIFRLGQ